MPEEEKGKKFDEGKLRYDLVPVKALEETVKVLTKGATKYGDWNWHNGLKYSRLYAAAQRHLNAFWNGENIDYDDVDKHNLPASHHLANAMCCILFLLEFEMEGRQGSLDDRRAQAKLKNNELDVAVLANELIKRHRAEEQTEEQMEIAQGSSFSPSPEQMFRKIGNKIEDES